MQQQIYGYVRCSTKEQNEGRQINAMREFGVPDKNVLVEKVSGKDFNRPIYQNLMKTLKPGDTLVISSLDRLGRGYEGVIEEWRRITKEIGAYIVVADMPILDTRQKKRDLTGAFVADLFLQILSYVFEQELHFNHQRQAEGIAVAKAKGVKFGRPPKKRPKSFDRLKRLWLGNEISSREAANKLGVSHSTFLRWANAVP